MHARLGQNNASASLQKEVIHDFITELYSWFALGGKKETMQLFVEWSRARINVHVEL